MLRFIDPDSADHEEGADVTTNRTSVVFIHGLWLHATSWGPWMDVFRDAGYEPSAPGWPGTPDTVEAARTTPESVAGKGINDIVDHYTKIIGDLAAKPIAIGHSFGGLIAQRLLSSGSIAAAVAIDPAPIKGVLYLPPSALNVASIALRNPANRSRAISLTAEQFRYGFANAVSPDEANTLYERWAIPSPGRPLFEAATANFQPHSPAKVDTRKADRGPLLVTAGGKDHTVPPAVSRATVRLYGKSHAITDLRQFPDRGHSLTIDSGWREIADASLSWLKGHSL
jgi:pimeloyl-ACP methyl ester carboxylesterase